MLFEDVMTINDLKQGIEFLIRQEIPEYTPFCIVDLKGNIERIDRNSLGYSPEFGIYVRPLKN